MQPTQNSTPAIRPPHLLWFTRLRNVLLKPLMRSLAIIEHDIFIQNPLNLILASQQKVVQLLSSHCPEKPFHDAVHVRRFHSCSDRHEIVCRIFNIEHQSIVVDQIGDGILKRDTSLRECLLLMC
jgi:hypothetical protein